MKIKNLNVTEHFEKGRKKGFKLLPIFIACTLIAASFTGCSKEAMTHETVEIIQSQEQKTEFVNQNIEIIEPTQPDVLGMYDVVLKIGDIEVGPTQLDSSNPNDQQEATVNALVIPANNCLDFVCTTGTSVADKKKMVESFKNYIKGMPYDENIEFVNTTGKGFTWKTDRIEAANHYSVTQDTLDLLPEDMRNDDTVVQNVLNYICSNRYATFSFWDFEFFRTRDTATYLLRYDSEYNTVLTYDLTTHIRLDSTDWKGKGFWRPFNNTSQGFESLLTDRKEWPGKTIHSDLCAAHYNQSESISVLRRELTISKVK